MSVTEYGPQCSYSYRHKYSLSLLALLCSVVLCSSSKASECGGHTSVWVRGECLMDIPRPTSQCPPSTVLHSVLEGGGWSGGLTQHLWTCQHHVPNNRTCSRDTVHCDCDSPQQCGEVGRCHWQWDHLQW